MQQGASNTTQLVAKKSTWLDTLLDGDVTPDADDAGATARPAMRKLRALQRAFSALQWAEIEAPCADEALLFKWGDLSVLAHIHTGLEAELFRAFDPMLQREVALKLRGIAPTSAVSLSDAALSEPASVADRVFIQSAQRLATVRHPNVLAVQGAALHEGRAGMWMDLVQGETLSAHIIRHGQLSAKDLLTLATQLSSALCAVHAKALTHGELVPNKVICETAIEGRYLLLGGGVASGLEAELTTNCAIAQVIAQAQEADIRALGCLVFFAATASTFTGDSSALTQRGDLSAGLRTLVRSIVELSATTLTAQQLFVQCQGLRDAPAREQRARLRRTLLYLLIGVLISSLVTILFTLHARTVAQTQRDRAVTVRDFLLNVLRAPNPNQSATPTYQLVQIFANAITSVPKTFAADPRTEAQLLHQFGRSMIVFDQDTQALNALTRADARFAQAGVKIAEPERIETRSFLSDVYRTRRNYPAAWALTKAQAQLCARGQVLIITNPRACVAIINDHIEATGYGGDALQALELVSTNLALEKSAQLELEYESVFTTYLGGVMLRDAGRFADSRAAFVRLSERTLSAVPAGHPGLLTDFMWLSWSADDLGEIALAQSLNNAAWVGRAALYTASSRYVLEVRIQAATLALHAGDHVRATSLAKALINEVPNTLASAHFIEQAVVLAALAEGAAATSATASRSRQATGQAIGQATGPNITEAALIATEQSRLRALGASAPKLAELRLNLSAVAILRGKFARAKALLAESSAVSAQPNAAYLAPLYMQLQSHMASAQTPPNVALAEHLRARAAQLLQQQNRWLFDPVAGRWIGSLTDPALEVRTLTLIAEKIRARRATSNASTVP
jgi:tRNA A-37 threonylcarbamoyl transferase component Bud32